MLQPMSKTSFSKLLRLVVTRTATDRWEERMYRDISMTCTMPQGAKWNEGEMSRHNSTTTTYEGSRK